MARKRPFTNILLWSLIQHLNAVIVSQLPEGSYFCKLVLFVELDFHQLIGKGGDTRVAIYNIHVRPV